MKIKWFFLQQFQSSKWSGARVHVGGTEVRRPGAAEAEVATDTQDDGVVIAAAGACSLVLVLRAEGVKARPDSTSQWVATDQ